MRAICHVLAAFEIFYPTTASSAGHGSQRALTGTCLVRDDSASRVASLTASSHLRLRFPASSTSPLFSRKATHAQILLRRRDRCNDCGCHRARIGPAASDAPGRSRGTIRLRTIDGTRRRLLVFREPQEW